jgi:hypothetical protein
MADYKLLHNVTHASGSLKAAHEFIVGGQLTGILSSIGDVHLRSARDHLRQAENSQDPQQRIASAGNEMQNAYFFYDASSKRGVASLRPFFDPIKLRKTHELAAESASCVALVQWRLGESGVNCREWLDRVREHLIGCDIALRKSPVDAYMRMGKTGDMFELSMLFSAFGSYYALQKNLLPSHLARQKPRKFLLKLSDTRHMSEKQFLSLHNWEL